MIDDDSSEDRHSVDIHNDERDQNVFDGVSDGGDSDKNVEVQNDRENLIYYPSSRRSERHTDGQPPDWCCYNETHLVTVDEVMGNSVPQTYRVALSRKDSPRGPHHESRNQSIGKDGYVGVSAAARK